MSSQLSLRSIAFSHGGHIPPLYTCEEKNINPPLEMEGIPDDAQTMALIVDDPDAPRGTFYHWLMWNIPTQKNIHEDSTPGICGKNSFGRQQYDGPCPPDGEHRYFFRLFALDTFLELSDTATHTELEAAMEGHILASTELMGYYKKRGQS